MHNAFMHVETITDTITLRQVIYGAYHITNGLIIYMPTGAC